MKRILTACLLVLVSTWTYGQISVPGTPPSFETKQLTANVPVISLPALNLDEVFKQDELDEKNGLPPRFGVPIKTSYNLLNSGVWENHPDGGRVWKLRITAANALSINFCYDKYYLPEGAQLYIYNQSRRQVIGAFTSINNKAAGGMATGLVFGDDVTLELYEPAETVGLSELSINQITHGYRYIEVALEADGVEESFGDSGSCQVNVNCSPEGDNWQDEKRSVAMILVSGTRWCSGSLINTTRGDCTPYFLTADHCLTDGYDAISNPNMTNWSFYWNYESPGCSDGSDFTPISTNAGTLIANDSPSDFALILLTESPVDAGAGPYFNGWDATFSPGVGGVGIHHPSGDIKKIATHSTSPLSDDWFGTSPAGSHWDIQWDATLNGHSVTEGGSSGSPLFNSSKRVIGQLHGGSSINCSDPINDPGIYGAVAYSWNNAGAADNRRKLSPWLDPDGTGVTVLDGTFGDCGLLCLAPAGLNATVSGMDATLAWTASSTALSYLMRYRSVGSSIWTDVSTATTSVLVSSLAECTQYEFQVASVCDSSTSSYTSSAVFTSDGCPCPTYCAAGGGTVDEWAESITVGPLVNNSGDNGGYVDFTGTPFTAAYDMGSAYSISLTPGYSGTIYNEWWNVFIDYNQDGDFDDTGEEIYNSGSASSATVTGSFTVPTGLAGSTGLRVIMRYNSDPATCGTFTYGEVEDYCIEIVDPAGCTSATAPTGITHTDGASSVTLQWTAVSGSVGCRIKGQRISPPSTSSPTLNILGFEVNSTVVPYSAVGAGTTWTWQVQCACSLSPIDASPYSIIDTFSVGSLRTGEEIQRAELFPNPADASVNLEYVTLENTQLEIRVVNVLGETVLVSSQAVGTGSNMIQINTASLPSGNYIVNVINGERIEQGQLSVNH
ncbi:MAG: lysyl endopeptidase [Limisphaerales bacterium]|jgi:lysyl endopeptidase